MFCCLHGFLPASCLSDQDEIVKCRFELVLLFIRFEKCSFPGIQLSFVCNPAGSHQVPSNRVTFEDCNSSVDYNLLRAPDESSIFLSCPYRAKAPITKEMTRNFNNITRLSFEPCRHCLHCLALPCIALPCLALPFLALPCLALPCLALPCLALPCLALPCLALPCLASPCLALPSKLIAIVGIHLLKLRGEIC